MIMRQRGRITRSEGRPTVRRRAVLGALAAAPLLACLPRRADAATTNASVSSIGTRAHPGDPRWPSAEQWETLRRQTGGRLAAVESPSGVCRDAPNGPACSELFRELKNPYYIGDQAGLTQTTGWLDGWTSQPSVYAVAAESTADVVAAVNFARTHDLRLVVKGGGHSYLGRSNAPDSLLIWTRHMNDVVPHDAFVAEGCAGQSAPKPAVSIGAGTIWGHAYNEVTTKGGRYVQGGGCLTVGVAGLVQAGGFGSFSKRFGTAAANLLEAEVVTADGAVLIANACSNADLFWGLKGGGGGSLAVVTRLTLRTHTLPDLIGGVRATIHAHSDAALRRIVGRLVTLYADSLCNPDWGDIVTLRPGRRVDIRMTFIGLDQRQAEDIWRPLFDWIAAAPEDFSTAAPPIIQAIPARNAWDPAFLRAHLPQIVRSDDRPGAPEDNVFWAGNQAEAGHFIFAYQSLWLPRSLLAPALQDLLADTLCEASRHAPVELHFQKGLSGGTATAVAATRDTAMNPKVLDAFVLAIVGGEGPPAYPGMSGHEPDLENGRRSAGEVALAMAALKRLAPDGGCYFAESDFFESGWQDAYWGANYPRLLQVKRDYDPTGLFFVHHGVGSEAWSADGFRRIAER
jgi:FAD/FMN-containing dehydrogenase